MDEFTKSVKITFSTDKASYDKIRKMLEDTGKDIKVDPISEDAKEFLEDLQKFSKEGIISDENLDKFVEQFQSIERINEQIESLTRSADLLTEIGTEEAMDAASKLLDKVEKLQKTVSISDTDETVKPIDELKSSLKDFATNKMTRLGDWFLSKLESIFSEAWQEMSEMLKYSKLTDSTIRDQALTYGFNAAQNYAFSKTKDLLGISNDEDLYYMDQAQRQKFYEKFNEYSSKYDRLYDQGFFKTLEEFNWERQEFEEDIKYSIIEFFMNNKDTIKSALQAMINMGEWFIKAFGWLVEGLNTGGRSESQRAAATSQIINKYSANTSKNVSIDNTFNNTSSSDRSFFSQSLNLMKEQIIKSI